jgi:hypothetical protein
VPTPSSSLRRPRATAASQTEPPPSRRLDRAGWHCANDLAVPANLTPVFLPPYSPELNAIERRWLYLKERFLSHRLLPAYDDILDACCRAWNTARAETGRIRSLCDYDRAKVIA